MFIDPIRFHNDFKVVSCETGWKESTADDLHFLPAEKRVLGD